MTRQFFKHGVGGAGYMYMCMQVYALANVCANKISTIPRQYHPAAITQMVMDGLHCPLSDTMRIIM